ncbi:MAG: hypothetical protein JKY70_19935 [Mucilaginibacter sp.]|nr:hypothetical protein [Mucilaginibacter sp.]
MEPIDWKTFKNTLLSHPDLRLQFKYAEDKFVDPAYHITEIKQAPIISVDCGGVLNQWTEVIVQLWVPDGAEPTEAMKVSKALSIIDIVEKLLSLDPFATVKIEFGNPEFHTRQMFPKEMIIADEIMLVDLRPDAVQCKAISRGGSCGTSNSGEECCTPAKTKVELKSLAVAAETSCTPGSGCC